MPKIFAIIIEMPKNINRNYNILEGFLKRIPLTSGGDLFLFCRDLLEK